MENFSGISTLYMYMYVLFLFHAGQWVLGGIPGSSSGAAELGGLSQTEAWDLTLPADTASLQETS